MTDFDRIIQAMRDDYADRQAWRERFLADFEANVDRIVTDALTRVLHPSVQRPAPAPLPANDLQPDEPPPPEAA